MKTTNGFGGHMSAQWTVWCALCFEFEQAYGSKSACAQVFKARGWRKVKGSWQCPKHLPLNQTVPSSILATVNEKTKTNEH